MGLLNSRLNTNNNNNRNNNNMECYDIDEYNNMVNDVNNFELNNNNDNMFCMQCQNFGSPCTCVDTTEYIPDHYNEQDNIELLSQYEPSYTQCHTPPQQAFFIPPAPIGK
jgi:hypothetical protein